MATICGMANFQDALDPRLRRFIEAQQMFFTATAPLLETGRINLSPKGMDTFHIFSDREVGYLDLTGSGNETAAHIRDNGRLTIMFCSFGDKPLILRLYGRGEVTLPDDEAWPSLISAFRPQPGQRQIIRLMIQSVQTSCGFGVPHYEFRGQRDTLTAWAQKKDEDDFHRYWREKNHRSIDGLPTPFSASRK